MTKIVRRWGAPLLVLLGATAAHAFFGRDKVEGLWPEKAVQVDGRANEWQDMPVLETAGIGFRAMNDAGNLYLLIRGANSDGKVVLSGRYRQNVTLWFLKADHKSKDWGINLDFGNAYEPEGNQAHSGEVLPLAAFGVTPVKVISEGLEVSTASLPAEMEFAADLSSQNGRQPIYEIRIPLSMVARSGRSIDMDFVTSEVSPDAREEVQTSSAQPSHSASSGIPGGSSGSPAGGGRHRRGMGGSPSGSGGAQTVAIPKPLTLHLDVSLAKEPKH